MNNPEQPTPRTDENKKLRAEFAKSDAVKLQAELEKANRTLEAYRKRARKLYTPEVAATKITEEEERMRNVDAQLARATALLTKAFHALNMTPKLPMYPAFHVELHKTNIALANELLAAVHAAKSTQ